MHAHVQERWLNNRLSRTTDLDMIRYLLSRGADPNANANYALNAFELAAFRGHLLIVKELLDAGAQLETRTALTNAAHQGHLDVVTYLLDHGAAIDEIPHNADMDEDDRVDFKTALCEAADNGQSAVVELLLRRGANPEIKDMETGRSALELATLRGISKSDEFSRNPPSRDYDGCIAILQGVQAELDVMDAE